MDKNLRNLLQNERKHLYSDFSAIHKTQQKLYKEIIKEQNNLLNRYPKNERQARALVDAINSYDAKVDKWVVNAMKMEKIEKHIKGIRLKLHAGIQQPSKAFKKMGYQENSAINLLEKRNETFYPKVFHGLIEKVSSFYSPGFTFTRGEAKIPEKVDLDLSKKTLQVRKNRLTAELKVLHKEVHEWKNELEGLTKQVLQSQKDIQNPDFRTEFITGLESHHSIDNITRPVLDSVESLHSSMLSYGAALIHLHKKDEQLFETREKINSSKEYVEGSKTLKELNYKRGDALATLTKVHRNHYTPQVLGAIDYIRSQGAEVERAVNVHRRLDTNNNIQIRRDLQTGGSFADRTNAAKDQAKTMQNRRLGIINQDKSRKPNDSKQKSDR